MLIDSEIVWNILYLASIQSMVYSHPLNRCLQSTVYIYEIWDVSYWWSMSGSMHDDHNKSIAIGVNSFKI